MQITICQSAQQSSTHPRKIIKLHPPVSTGRPSPGGALGLSLDLDNLAFGAREVMDAIGSVVELPKLISL